MNIEGLDYNTQRERLTLPEYGREIQSMVDQALTLPTREERTRCAEQIVAVMERMYPQVKTCTDYRQKLWDHLAIMSHFQLDIDWPCDTAGAKATASKPEPLGYPMAKIPVMHYGKILTDIFERLKTMEPGAERDELVRMTANQMRRDLYLWSHGSVDEEKVVNDLARLTDGRIRLDLATFRFDRIVMREPEKSGKRGRRNR